MIVWTIVLLFGSVVSQEGMPFMGGEYNTFKYIHTPQDYQINFWPLRMVGLYLATHLSTHPCPEGSNNSTYKTNYLVGRLTFVWSDDKRSP